MTDLRSESGGDRKIAVRPDHPVPKALLRLVALAIWLVGGYRFIENFFVKGAQSIPILAWLFILIWLGGGFIIVLDLMWILFGVQQVLIGSETLTVIRKIGPASTGKSRTFALDHIRGMRIEELKYQLRGKTAVNRTMTFDYLGKKHLLLSHLSATRAESLLSGPLHKFASD